MNASACGTHVSACGTHVKACGTHVKEDRGLIRAPAQSIGEEFLPYFCAVSNRLFTSSQFTVFHHAARYSGRLFWYFR